MADKGRDPNIAAIESVYAALKDLDEASRRKVLASVYALLDMSEASPTKAATVEQRPAVATSTPSGSRPTSLNELINEKKPGTNAQRIVLFAYYRERSEGLSRFARGDLADYFSKARLPPAGNFDRDFVEAVRKGWIHEDDADSYLTTKGIEAVESGFEGQRKISSTRLPLPNRSRKSRKKRARRH
jgi:hypothetical protein